MLGIKNKIDNEHYSNLIQQIQPENIIDLEIVCLEMCALKKASYHYPDYLFLYKEKI